VGAIAIDNVEEINLQALDSYVRERLSDTDCGASRFVIRF